MESISALAQRVGELRSQVLAPAPAAQGFSAVLAARIGPVDPGEATGTTAAGEPPASAAVTLGQLLGLGPVSFSAAGPGGPAPAAGAPGPGGLLLPVQGRFTSGFGDRIHPVTGRHRHHAGVDLAAPTGTPIAAAQAGTVTFAGTRGGYGNLVIVTAPDGTETRYAHASRLDVRAGEGVAAGQVLGAVGSTGMSTGPHLHFEVRRGGEAIDPAPLLGL